MSNIKTTVESENKLKEVIIEITPVREFTLSEKLLFQEAWRMSHNYTIGYEQAETQEQSISIGRAVAKQLSRRAMLLTPEEIAKKAEITKLNRRIGYLRGTIKLTAKTITRLEIYNKNGSHANAISIAVAKLDELKASVKTLKKLVIEANKK
jgi:hypothetical protein